jgi:hypothetical protein
LGDPLQLAQTRDPGLGKDGGIDLAPSHLLQPGVDVAPQFDRSQIGALLIVLSSPARAAGANHGALAKVAEGRPHQHIKWGATLGQRSQN